jgi:signal peptide peptidase SppA
LRIAQQIQDSIWLITDSGLNLILNVFERKMAGDSLTDEQLAMLMDAGHGSDVDRDEPYQIQDGMAVLPIYGPIFGKANLMTQLSGATSMEQFQKDFQMAVDDTAVKSILLDIDSPGGTSDLIEEAGELIYESRGAKPIYALANDQAGSAAFWLATQASKLYGTTSGEVGSVGAYTVHKDQSKADANAGHAYTIISAGKYKTEGNPHEPLSQAGREYRQEVITELYDGFVSAVARGRGVDVAKVDADYGEGRMVPNKKALIRGMIDGNRTFESASEEIIAKHPKQFSFMMGDKPVTGTIVNGQLAVSPTTEPQGYITVVGDKGPELIALSNSWGNDWVSNADYEHSEPGTGSPPQRKEREDRDIAIESGSRRGDLPDPWPEEGQFSTPGAPKAQSEGTHEAMTDEPNVRAQLYQLLGVENDEQLLSAVTELKSTDDALRNDVDTTKSFASDYPDMYERLLRSEARERDMEADKFIASISTLRRPQGSSFVSMKLGLSAQTQETLKEVYLNAVNGKATVAQFEAAVRAITQGGVVDYSEAGSSRMPEVDTETSEVFSNSGSIEDIQNVRTQFSTKIQEIQRSDNLSYKDAIAEATKRYPDLARAYKTAVPVK